MSKLNHPYMTQFWGDRCPEYYPGCPACEAWALFDEKGGIMPSEDEVALRVNEICNPVTLQS